MLENTQPQIPPEYIIQEKGKMHAEVIPNISFNTNVI